MDDKLENIFDDIATYLEYNCKKPLKLARQWAFGSHNQPKSSHVLISLRNKLGNMAANSTKLSASDKEEFMSQIDELVNDLINNADDPIEAKINTLKGKAEEMIFGYLDISPTTSAILK